MLFSNIELLHHIFDEADFILSSSKNKTKEDVVNDPVLSRAIIRSMEIIGEASKKIDPEFKSGYPYIEWKKMAGTRDKLIHDYFGVDNDLLWDIIENKLPDLKDNVEEIIKNQNN